MLVADRWVDYEILDCGDGEKLERWGDIILRRPDPQVIWPRSLNDDVWNDIHAVYHRSSKGGGYWEKRRKMPDNWTVGFELATGRMLTFGIEPTGFKHTGLFPEQAANWDWMSRLIEDENKRLYGDKLPEKEDMLSRETGVRVLNLFAYTGGATVACAAAGASVCHVDASKGMVAKARGNVGLSGLDDAPVRYIVDDVNKFVSREIRRGHRYDGIILDPPSYGRGPKGELWHLEEELFGLIDMCSMVLSDRPLFFLINSYTTGLAPSVLRNVMIRTLGKRIPAEFPGEYSAEELMIPVTGGESGSVDKGLMLPCGSSGRWQRK